MLFKKKKKDKNFIEWNFIGIGIFGYFNLFKYNYFSTSIYSNSYLFRLSKPYIECLFQDLNLFFIGKLYLNQLLNSFNISSIELKDNQLDTYFELLQVII